MPARPAAPALETMMRIANATLPVLVGVVLIACSPPGPPQEERRPAPQAGVEAQPRSGIVQTADAYKDRARSAETESLEAADRQRAEIDAQTQ